MDIITSQLKNFAKIHKTIQSIENLLKSLGVTEFYSISEDEIRCTCPIHGGDNNTAFVAYPKYGIFICYSHNCHELKSNKLIDLPKLCKQKVDLTKIEKPTKIILVNSKKQKITQFELKYFFSYRDYQVSRGIPETPLFSYFDKHNQYYMKDRAVFLLWNYEKTKILGISGRGIKDCVTPVWKHVLQKNESHCVYFPHSISYKGNTTCLLSEGIIDAIKLELALKIPSIGILGSSITFNKARKLVEYFDNFVIIPDHDFKSNKTNPGLEGAKKTLSILREFGKSAKIIRLVPDNYDKSVDPGDFEISKLSSLLKSQI